MGQMYFIDIVILCLFYGIDIKMNTAGVVKLNINSICPGTTNFIVVGIIIAKQDAKVITSNTDKEISVFSFTLRDSLTDVINVSVWGTKDFTRQLYNYYKIGDVVDLINPNVKCNPEIEKKWMPKSSCSFYLTLNENSSQMLAHDVNDSINYKHYLRIPTYPHNLYLKIKDIDSSGKEMCGKWCSLLVAVRCVRSTKTIKTKIGKEAFLKEIVVMDETHPTLIVSIWDKELSEMATQWAPKKTILAFSDLYLKWNNFKNIMTAVVSNKTIITVDPIMNEANNLKNYAHTYLIGLSNKLNINIPNLSSITDIMTCKRVLINSNERSRQQFSAVLYGIVSDFNIDGSYPLFFTKCNICGMYVDNTHLICLNPDCSIHFKMEIGSDELECELNIRLSLTDSTGTLENCILHNQAALKILSEVNHFQNMSLVQKTNLKWKYLFSNCVTKLVVTKPQHNQKSTILVVDIDNEGPISQFISCIPIY